MNHFESLGMRSLRRAVPGPQRPWGGYEWLASDVSLKCGLPMGHIVGAVARRASITFGRTRLHG